VGLIPRFRRYPPGRVQRLADLAESRFARFEQTGADADLDAATAVLRQAAGAASAPRLQDAAARAEGTSGTLPDGCGIRSPARSWPGSAPPARRGQASRGRGCGGVPRAR
jgi:hypothetical protein